ncbi:MAG: sulfatase-like hydrolase/transferase [Planctomycetota bacterium]
MHPLTIQTPLSCLAVAIAWTMGWLINASVAGVGLAAERPNVLFIAVDDLRPELTSFGADKMVTPNFDRLAKRGVRFDRAYCMVPTCGASRAALMTGIRPAKDRFRTYTSRADQDAPGVTTLNTHFKNNGYTTISLGKVFHNPADSAEGWSEPAVRPNADRYITTASRDAMVKDAKGRERGPSWENGGDTPDDTYTDGVIANRAIARLRQLAKQSNEPFFLAVGFTKPHLPFVAPGRYFEKYPTSDVRMPDNYYPPQDAPEGAVHQSGELRSYSDIPKKGVIPEAKARELIRGYHAATSYTDAHIGRLLDAYDELGLSENTIIVMWGDHGWNLGEHTMWCKHSCFETSLRAPLIFVTPDSMNLRTGATSSSLVEFIDIYPTLCELSGLPLPRYLDGQSIVPVLEDPSTQIKDCAVSRFSNGDSICTDRFRYTTYRDEQGHTTGHMLYDHDADPEENVNVADEAKYAEVVRELESRLSLVMGKPADFKLSEDKVQGEARQTDAFSQLKLTNAQRPRFQAIQRAMTAKWSEFQKMPAATRRTQQAEFFRARNAEMAELLTPAQLKQYREIRSRRRRTPTNATAVEPTVRSSDPSDVRTSADYSGHDLAGIESIVEATRRSDQPWRQEADQRIDQLRKANLELRIVDAEGNPRANVPVHVQLQRHSFRFGGIVGGPSMHEPVPGQRVRQISPEQYKKLFLDLGFNASGFHNYLKYKRVSQAEPHLPGLLAWFEQNKIPVRGHCLIWPGGTYGNFMPAKLSQMVYVPDPNIDPNSLKRRVPRKDLSPDERLAVEEVCREMVAEAAQRWPVFEWDVINETRDNHIVQDIIGRDAMVDWFKTARSSTRDPKALLYLNENKVISDPAAGDVTANMKRFENEVQYLLDQNAPLSGLGFQSRFGRQTPPEQIYERLEYFAKFGLPMAATEFEMKYTIGDELARAAMTERVMTVMFSHRLVNGIYAWSILAQDKGGKADRAILEDDGDLKLRGKVWMYLMKNHWSTDKRLTTNENGLVSLRGFKGDYVVEVGQGDTSEITQLQLLQDCTSEIQLAAE